MSIMTLLLIILGSIVYLIGMCFFVRWANSQMCVFAFFPMRRFSPRPGRFRTWEFDYYGIGENCVQLFMIIIYPFVWLIMLCERFERHL